jgi:hypothetical protein
MSANTLVEADNNSYADTAWHTELVYRGMEDDRIADLPFAQQAEARAAEMQRRSEWDAQQNSPSGGPLPSGPPIPVASNTSTTASPPPRKSRWRFKLKPKKKP